MKDDIKQIPYVVHEAAMQRMKDALRRMFIALMILLVLLVIITAMWYFK